MAKSDIILCLLRFLSDFRSSSWTAQNETDHGIILKRKNPTTAKQLGFYAWVSPKRFGS